MDHLSKEKIVHTNKFGFHYFRDVENFTLSEAKKWANVLLDFNVKWLVVQNPKNRAIPEYFIKSFSSAKITIIVDFNLTSYKDFNLSEIEPLLNVYGKWGVKYANLFHQPNTQAFWGESKWNSMDIVKAHSGSFHNFAKLCMDKNIVPVFPPLHPGGEYWDLAFLERSLSLIKTDLPQFIIDSMSMSVYGWDWNHPISRNTNGKLKPSTMKPFAERTSSKNQIGFRTYETYLKIAERVLGNKLPVVIFEAGIPNGNFRDNEYVKEKREVNLTTITKLLAGENVYDPQDQSQILASIARDVLCCNFFVLAVDSDERYQPYGWFNPDGSPTHLTSSIHPLLATGNRGSKHPVIKEKISNAHYAYNRYIYFSHSLMNEMPALLEVLDPYIRKFKPRIGFSLMDAEKSAHILIITSDPENFRSEQAHILSNNSIIRIISPIDLNNLMEELIL